MSGSAKKRTLQVLVVLTCLETILLLSIVIHWRLIRESFPDDVKQQELCYRQDNFLRSADNKKSCPLGLVLKKENTTEVCCGTLGLVLDNIVTKVMSERYNSDANPDHVLLDLGVLNCKKDIKWKQQYLKLVGIIKDKTQEKGENVSSLLWNSLKASDVTSSFTYNPDEGTIFVKEVGFYLVQSQIKVKVNTAYDTDDDIDETIKHSIFLKAAGQDKGTVVLEGAKTKCKISSEESEITSTLGAAFKLKERDRLFVATSHPKLLAEDDNFFSIQKL